MPHKTPRQAVALLHLPGHQWHKLLCTGAACPSSGGERVWAHRTPSNAVQWPQQVETNTELPKSADVVRLFSCDTRPQRVQYSTLIIWLMTSALVSPTVLRFAVLQCTVCPVQAAVHQLASAVKLLRSNNRKRY